MKDAGFFGRGALSWKDREAQKAAGGVGGDVQQELTDGRYVDPPGEAEGPTGSLEVDRTVVEALVALVEAVNDQVGFVLLLVVVPERVFLTVLSDHKQLTFRFWFWVYVWVWV